MRLCLAPKRWADLVRRGMASDDLSEVVRGKILSRVTQQQPATADSDSPSRAVVTCDVASELLYEVGWESRHVYVDVRAEDAFRRGRPKGAVNVPYRNDDEFATTAVERIGRDPGRVVVGGKHASSAAAVMNRVGFRPVVLDGDFEQWRAMGLPIEVDGCGQDDLEEDDGDPANWR